MYEEAAVIENPALQAQLVRIWETAQHLQRQPAQPVPVEGYRQDALEQIERVQELINEYKADPDGASWTYCGCRWRRPWTGSTPISRWPGL